MKIGDKGDTLFFKTPWGYSASSVRLGPMTRRQVGILKMQAFDANVRDRILALVKTILEQNSIVVELQPDSRLVDVGLTSMDMVNLMLGVEAEFDLTIPQAEITPENFQSVDALQSMIASQLQTEAAA
jgi:acyl carrier protein